MGVFVLDRDFRIVHANPKALSFLGVRQEDIPGRDVRETVPEPARGALLQAVSRAVREMGTISVEVPYPGVPGSALGFCCMPSEGDVTIVFQDLFRHREIECELGESEADYLAIFNAVNDAIFIHDAASGAILDANVKMTEMYGYGPEEIRRLSVGDLSSGVPPYTQEGAKERIADALRTGGTLFEWQAKRKSGEVFWVEVNLKQAVIGSELRIVAVVRDISSRKSIEEDLRVSEQRYRTLYETMVQGVLEFDAAGRLVSSNPAAGEILGLDLSGMKGSTLEGIYQAIPRGCREGGEGSCRDRSVSFSVTKDGRAIRDCQVKFYHPVKEDYSWLSLYSVPRVDPHSGKAMGEFTIFSDATDVKRAHLALQDANEKLELKVAERTRDLKTATRLMEEQKEVLQTIIDHIPVMLVFYDAAGRVRLVNREFERLIGWSLDEIRGMDLLEACCPDAAYLGDVWEYMLGAAPGWKDFEITARSGGIVHSSWANVRLSDGSQIGIGIDISERMKLEQELLRLATAMDQAAEGIVLFSPDGVIEYVNPAYERLYGYSRQELIGRTTEVLGEEIHRGYQEICQKVSETGGSWIGRKTRTTKGGGSIEVSLTVSPVISRRGSIMNFVSISRDVTHEVRIQQHINQTQKIEALGTLAGGIAHDLKNVLTPILINTEIALEDISEDSPAHPVLEEALDAARLGKDLVNQILTFSRRTPQRKRPVNIATVVRETLSFLRSSLPATVEIRHRQQDGCFFAVADPTQIKQVLINLGSNAQHAMKENGGVLEIGLEAVELDEREVAGISPDLHPGPHLRIMVKDTGSGMDEGTMEHIFEPFFTTKRKGEGTGLGLAVALGIVKEHQGVITVNSSPGAGTSFTILLPGLECGEAGKGHAAARAS
ncbi:MAG TPA: PAS domain S-box protein [Deltaproteobacteria bacterium]|jgi:PAS domain S-box-containing protein|nr:PAS domain S-box protein [Deltaproteobacteria bacterium]HOI06884.1 PAS domain S-box protein [Deltaproteobacteria bacterium]